MLVAMFEDFSRNRRFAEWLEAVAEGERSAYPEPESFADDARSFHTRFDRLRSDQRLLEKSYRELAASLGELAGLSPKARPEQALDAVRAKLGAAEESSARQAAEHESQLETVREGLEAARAELESTRVALAETRSELQREQRKLEPVLRYAYNLRRLVQKIHAKGELTPSIRRYIEELLEAGGASVKASAPRPVQSRSADSNSTIT